jgi:hypothetical protein
MVMPKSKLPIKTKIAVWWIIVIGIILTIVLISAVPAFTDWSYPIDQTLYWIAIAIGFLIISPSILICFKNKLIWISSTIILSVEVLLEMATIGYIASECLHCALPLICFFPLLLIPLILLILDKKNYFEMVRQRELEKKDDQT